MMEQLPDLIALMVTGQPAATVLDDMVDDPNESDIDGVIDDRFEGGKNEEGAGDAGSIFVDHAVSKASCEGS